MSAKKQFSEKAQEVLAIANQESKRLRCDHVASEHLLLGLLIYGQGVGSAMLSNAGLVLDCVQTHVASIGVEPEMASHGYGPSMRGALFRSFRHAESLLHPKIEPEHLALGLLDETDGGAVRVLRHFGVDTATTRRHILERIA